MKLKIFDDGGDTADRYTVVFMGAPTGRHTMMGWALYDCLTLSEDPTHPCGICQHGESVARPVATEWEIKLEELPEKCRAIVQKELAEYAAAGAA